MTAPLKVLITETQLEKLKRNSHLSHVPTRLYVRVDHRGRGGHELAVAISNPFHKSTGEGETVEMEGEGLKKIARKLKKAADKTRPVLEGNARFGADVAKQLAPALVASGNPKLAAIGVGLQTGASVTDQLVPPEGGASQQPAQSSQSPGTADTTALLIQYLLQLQQAQEQGQQSGSGHKAAVRGNGRYRLAKKKH